MSRLAEFRQLEQRLAQQLAELEALKGSAELQKEIAFETKLRDLLAEYGCSLHDVINILDPQASQGKRRVAAPVATEKAPRRPRQLKQYRNPHTGEVIETKGGNHTKLKQWKAEHGSDEVESWVAR
ncbi:histone-like nucleoid-structuring protein, MvaT/MvaU family [Pseudomonas sp. BNK-30]|uniref:histone-like nucleoid-structuring protein, MvaT/MvaU family n=1 Tax=Pseudomonas sp. BNK-30 TaxID=3376165 RepID=UPI0039BFF7CF